LLLLVGLLACTHDWTGEWILPMTFGPIESHTAEVAGLTLRHLTAGHGQALILLHGYTQTPRRCRPFIGLLAKKFTVIAPDLPGIGGSDGPTDIGRTNWLVGALIPRALLHSGR
jgi:pimeloyl-ACP methyl ester carboxylesterase